MSRSNVLRIITEKRFFRGNMIYRRFGKTELSMPVLSFGCMRSMHIWEDEKREPVPDHANRSLKALVEQALHHGLTHIENRTGIRLVRTAVGYHIA